MIIVTQCIIKYAFFSHFTIETRLGWFGFILLVLATVFIAAAGYVINDIYDIKADTINKPTKRIVGVTMSIKNARTLYYTLSAIGLGLGLTVSMMIEKPLYSSYFIGCSLCLYVYSSYLKTIPLIGNILVSLLVGASLLILGVFDLFPLQKSENQFAVFSILKDITLFAILVNFLREIVKDIEDLKGDYAAQYSTLPIIFGTNRTARITASIGIVCTLFISTYILIYFNNETVAIVSAFVLIIAPLAYVCMLLWDANSKKAFSKISFLLKIIMFIGITMIPFISKFIDYAL